ncbi:aldose 1-/Glucose-6-phosphate 1-epimerase [Kipferlia bialata]|uniref:Aldose 1-/Glucose-6-phosphate 1-epimerase n=1 Tax=Kipferlia bialata TaxID=797122 RepID=A0A9K3GGY7_9EUKA|nr:aldose 1-/Glucose-6-phosphate 1-epimerase [Kipferlia bialata]|eukprot:g3290.t1
MPWSLTGRTEDTLVLETDYKAGTKYGPRGLSWPGSFHGRVVYKLAITAGVTTLTVTTAVTHTSAPPLPYGTGTHPYFARQWRGHGAQIQVEGLGGVYELDNCLPRSGETVPIPEALDFSGTAHTFPTDSTVDDIFIRDPSAETVSVAITYGDAMSLTLESQAPHWVLYSPPAQPYFAVEPVTNCNDAFNLCHDTPAVNAVTLAEGETLSLSYTMTIETK